MTCDIRKITPWVSPEEKSLADLEKQEQLGEADNDEHYSTPVQLKVSPVPSFTIPQSKVMTLEEAIVLIRDMVKQLELDPSDKEQLVEWLTL